MRATADLRRRILNRSARVAVVGQGYVGLSLACAAAEAGFTVTGVDVDAHRIAGLGAGQPVVAGVDEKIFRSAFESGRRDGDKTQEPVDELVHESPLSEPCSPIRLCWAASFGSLPPCCGGARSARRPSQGSYRQGLSNTKIS
jgi:hypothetical protein